MQDQSDYIVFDGLMISEGELAIRAREAYIATRRPARWRCRAIRAGLADRRLGSIIRALRDLARPMTAVVADHDEATVALILNSSVNLPRTPEVVNAIRAAVRIGRRG